MCCTLPGTGGEYWTDAIARKAVSEWLSRGGRRLDTSLAWYHDLKGVGQGIVDSGVPREEVFVLSKVDYPYTYNATLQHMDELLATLNDTYVDLLLLHWPGAPSRPESKVAIVMRPTPAFGCCRYYSRTTHARSSRATPKRHTLAAGAEQWNFTSGAVPTFSAAEPPPGQESCGVGRPCRQQAWLALEHLFKTGKAKAIGVANFEMGHMQDLLDLNSLIPAVNQIEFHPYWAQFDLVKQMQRLRIQTCGYAPLGSPDFMNNHRDLWPTLVTEQPEVHRVATRHNVTPAQVLIRWSLQNGAHPYC